jgi:hypothetical protein
MDGMLFLITLVAMHSFISILFYLFCYSYDNITA